MSANITSGNIPSYDAQHGVRIFQGLKPDLVLIQEFNYGDNSESSIREFVDLAFGSEFHYYREEGKDKTIPNGIISRFPILEAGALNDPTMTNRELVWARIDLPGETDLVAYSLHLNHGNRGNRLIAAKEVARDALKRTKPNEFLVIGGDLNTKGQEEGSVLELRRVVQTTPVPIDTQGSSGTNAHGTELYDWVMPNAALSQHEVCIDLLKGLSRPEKKGLVFDSRTFPRLELVAPIRKTDSGAPNMQHKPVIRDFEIP